MKLPYAATADDIQTFYLNTQYLGDNGLAGAATEGYERSGDHNKSPYYNITDFYGTQNNLREAVGSDTLKIISNYKTVQQATEWSCGPSSLYTVIEHFQMNKERENGQYETPISLATHRTKNAEGATYRSGILEMVEYMSDQYDENWVTFTDNDLDEPREEWSSLGKFTLQDGAGEGHAGLIPYLIDHNIPMIIGWDEWGGHWQTIIGYDGMGTEGTQDDVLILADSYDTTDHNQNGYVIESFERLVFGWNVDFETRPGDAAEDEGYNDFVIAIPNTPEYQEVINNLRAD